MLARLYSRDGCPQCSQAGEFLTRSGVAFERVSIDRTPVPGAVASDLVRQARRLIIKRGDATLRFDSEQSRISPEQVDAYLVHPDGRLRVPVLVIGDLLVRGYGEDIYREALAGGAGPAGLERRGDMIITETERSTYLDVSRIEWEPTRYSGVEIKTLYRSPSGGLTTLTRMAPGARLPAHRHVGVEQSFVLQGTLVDDDGECTAGNFVHRRAGSVHDAWSPAGCVVLGIFEKPNEFLP